MEILINLLILVITLFLYIHLYNQVKTSNYLEIYEIDNISKDKFEELCELKQPLLINNINILNIDLSYIINNYENFDVKVINKKEKENIYLPMKLVTVLDLLKKDISGNYLSENNYDFLEETSLNKEFSKSDIFLRPLGVSSIKYDIIFGSINSYTPLKYDLNCRNYFIVLNGSVEITLCPPKDYKYLHVNKDYFNFIFKSSIDIFNPESKHKSDFDKIKFLRVVLKPDTLIQIPSYWFYNIKFLEDNTLVANYKYTTFMNSMASLPEYFINFLQKNNTKKTFTKIIS